jgi:hypothetical protein
MCKLIAELAGTDRSIVREIIDRLEKRSAEPGIDMRFTSEIYGSAHMKARALGLDPHDTTAKELYYALTNATKLHDRFLAERLSTKDIESNANVVEKIAVVCSKLNVPRQTWAIRPTKLREILKQLPPHNLQRLLNYRSVDSMIKREQPGVLLAAAKYTEPLVWQQKLKTHYRKLSSMDFQTETIITAFAGGTKWAKAAHMITNKSHANVVTAIESGTVLVLPVPGKHKPGMTIMTLAVVLHSYNEIRMYSSFFKFHQMQPGFGQWFVDALYKNHGHHVRVAGQDIHWRSVHRHYGRAGAVPPKTFQPHIQPEDIAYRMAEHVMYQLEPALYFWQSLDFVGWPQPDGPVSFNLMDNVINLVNELPYEKRVSYHMSQAVWDELYARYLGQGTIEQALLDQLDSRVVSEPVLADLEFAL